MKSYKNLQLKLLLIHIVIILLIANSSLADAIPLPNSVKQVSTNLMSTCVVTSDNKLYCTGYNFLAHEEEIFSTSSPVSPTLLLNDVSNVYLSSVDTDTDEDFKCALKTNGDLYCFGKNDNGQVGNGTTLDVLEPTKILEDVASVVLGMNNACVITTNAKLYCWGLNDKGQIGNNSTTNVSSPTQVLENVRSVNIKNKNTCAITLNNNLYCWGNNTNGQVGNASVQNVLVPTKILESIKKIINGNNTSCAITLDNELYCWGKNQYGQVGDNTSIDKISPVKVLEDVKDVALGNYHTCAVKTNNTLYCFGRNQYGQIGNGTTVNQLSPVQVLTNVKSTTLENDISCAILSDDTAKCWGRNDYAQVGNMSTENAVLPEEVLEIGTAKKIFLSNATTCVLSTDNNFYCWGRNAYGQLANGSNIDDDIPNLISANVQVASVSINHICIILTNGKLYCFGDNSYGQIGNNQTSFISSRDFALVSTPKEIGSNVTSVSLGSEHTCYINSNNDLYCFGRNHKGQIGTNNISEKQAPFKVLENVSSVDSFGNYSCAILTNKKLYCFGRGDEFSGAITPVNVLDDAEFVSVNNHGACAIKSNKELYCWDVSTNTATKQLDNVDELVISKGGDHQCAITTSRDLYCFGYNHSGQIGNGTSEYEDEENEDYSGTHRYINAPYNVLNNVRSVSLGSDSTCAMTIDDKLYCWGYNLWDDAGEQVVSTPTQIFDSLEISNVYLSIYGLDDQNIMCIIKANNDLICFGSNDNGEVGPYNTKEDVILQNVVDVLSLTYDEYPRTCALTSDSKLYCFGNNFDGGTLGRVTIDTDISTPLEILQNVKSFDFGYGHTCILTNDNKLYCFGVNQYEQVTNVNAALKNEIFDGSGTLPTFSNGCLGHWNYDSLNSDCTNQLTGNCLANGSYTCFSDNDNSAIICDAVTPACCEDQKYSLLSQVCKTGLGICQGSGAYYCSGLISSSQILCDAVSDDEQATNEICNSLDDDCDGTVDENFNVGAPCDTDEGTGTYICDGDNETVCNIINTYTPTFTNTNTSFYTATKTPTNTFTPSNTYTPSAIPTETLTQTPTQTLTQTLTQTYSHTFTRTPTKTYTFTNTQIPQDPNVIQVLTPKTKLPMPTVVQNLAKNLLTIKLPKIKSAKLNDKDKKANSNYRITVRLKKTKRNGKDKNYQLKVNVLKEIGKKQSVQFKKLDKGKYTVDYQITIINKNKSKKTSWSKQAKVEF